MVQERSLVAHHVGYVEQRCVTAYCEVAVSKIGFEPFLCDASQSKTSGEALDEDGVVYCVESCGEIQKTDACDFLLGYCTNEPVLDRQQSSFC